MEKEIIRFCSKSFTFCGAFVNLLLLDLFEASLAMSEDFFFNDCNFAIHPKNTM